MRHYIIHVGPHKTGTTYLQAAFKELRPVFRSCGVLYPEQWWLPGNPVHHLLFELLQEQKLDLLAQQFRAIEEVDCNTVLLSAEGLADLEDSKVAALHQILKGNAITIVIYIRRWSERLGSAWRENVVQGSSEMLPEFIAAHLSNPNESNQINPGGLIHKYAKVFGSESISIVSYSELMDRNVDILHHFAKAFLSIDLPPSDGAGRRLNELIGTGEAELARVLNSLTPRLGTAYLRKQHKLDVSTILDELKKWQKTLELNESDPILRRCHDICFSEFGDRLIHPMPDGEFFVPIRKKIPYISPNYLTDRMILEGIFNLQANLQADL